MSGPLCQLVVTVPLGLGPRLGAQLSQQYLPFHRVTGRRLYTPDGDNISPSRWSHASQSRPWPCISDTRAHIGFCGFWGSPGSQARSGPC